MNWEAVSAVGEWAGTIIVIITLVYLAQQVRLNTVTNRIAGITGIADAARETHFTLASSRDTARVFLVGISNPDELDEIDRGRFELFMWGVLRQMESRHVQYEHGIISESAMKAYAHLSVELIASNRIMREHWNKAGNYSPAFKSWIDEQVVQLGQTQLSN